MIEPKPTTRAVLEPSLRCNIKCKFCYHLYKMYVGDYREKDLDTMKREVDEAKDRGNDYLDITGGEPTIYPEIVNLVRYIKSKGMGCCIITNGIVSDVKARELMSAGLDDWLVSVHGLEDTHDTITNLAGARKKQTAFLKTIGGKMKFRFNCVLSRFNQNEILRLAEWMMMWPVYIVNFINMNPHGEWTQKPEDVGKVIADFRKVETQLNGAIRLLELNGIGVNVRYYPACRIREDYRRCICNDLQVCFDDKEWDYPGAPKTFDRYRQWGLSCTKNVEEKGEPCCRCDLQWICGGINATFHKASNKVYNEICEPQKLDELVDGNDFYFYRQHNHMTLGGK